MGIISNFLSSILLPKQLVLTFNGQTYQVLRTDPGYNDLYQATKEKDLRKLEELLQKYGYIKTAILAVVEELKQVAQEQGDMETVVPEASIEDEPNPLEEDDEEEFGEEEEEYEATAPASPTQKASDKQKDRSNVKRKAFQSLEVSEDGLLIINGVTFDNALSKKIADLYFTGYDIAGYYKLIRKIAENPMQAVKSGLLDFIAQNDLPITTDGTFLAYKVTDPKGWDKHSRTINYQEHLDTNKPVSMARKDVDKSRGVCSGTGLYFASIGYYGGNGYYGSGGSEDARYVVEVDPADVISIPTTYKNSKGRCCKMRVVRRIDWDQKNVPNSTSIMDLSKWEAIKPDPKLVEKHAQKHNTNIEVTGTQKLVKKKPEVVIEKLKKYITARHTAGVNPTLKNAQKAIKEPNVTISVGEISEMVTSLGFGVKELDEKPFGDSQIIKKRKK